MSKVIRFLAWTALVVGLLVGLARATVIRWWQVPPDDPYLQASLSPTLEAGDWVLTWRGSGVGVGDLVICPEPGVPGRVVVARVAAIEGQSVRVVGSDIFLDEQRVPTERACLNPSFVEKNPSNGIEVQQHCSEEVLGGRTHKRGEVRAADLRPVATADVRVPPGKVYLVSDNRHFPYDSRDFGTVERESCAESIFFRLWGAAGWSDVASRFSVVQ